jgi:anaerobic ribonucleoside-triphosphate reductase
LSTAIIPSLQASERLARADTERYGIAKVRFSGTREKPFYSTYDVFRIPGEKISPESLAFSLRLADLCAGGSLMAIDLGETKPDSSDLMASTQQLVESHVDFWTYDRKLTYCVNCKKSWFGLQHKCPSCDAVGTLAFFDRFAKTASQ